jgi:hypothetical protein
MCKYMLVTYEFRWTSWCPSLMYYLCNRVKRLKKTMARTAGISTKNRTRYTRNNVRSVNAIVTCSVVRKLFHNKQRYTECPKSYCAVKYRVPRCSSSYSRCWKCRSRAWRHVWTHVWRSVSRYVFRPVGGISNICCWDALYITHAPICNGTKAFLHGYTTAARQRPDHGSIPGTARDFPRQHRNQNAEKIRPTSYSTGGGGGGKPAGAWSSPLTYTHCRG